LNTYYSDNPNNLAHLPARPGRRARRPDFESALCEILAGCAQMLDPEKGRLVLTVRPYRQQGARVDPPAGLTAPAERSGLASPPRGVAPLGGRRGEGLVRGATFSRPH